ncbi:MAG: phage baseplate assembly protein V [Planctomycetota bacterium]|jgi:hypothetical protein
MDPNLDALLWNGRGRDSSGSEKTYGVVPAIVIEINDTKEKRHMMGAVKVRFPWLLDAGALSDINPWARCVSFAAGQGCGWITSPQIGDEVLVGFENGDIHTPYVLGGLFNPKGDCTQEVGGAAPADSAGGAGAGPEQGGGAGDWDGELGGAAAQQGGGGAPPPAAKPGGGGSRPAKKKSTSSKRPAAKKGRPGKGSAAQGSQAEDDHPGAGPGQAARPGAEQGGPAAAIEAGQQSPWNKPPPPPKDGDPKKPDDDTIPKGSVLNPPSDDKEEKKWFKRLEETSVNELEPGDILLRKYYGTYHTVKESQRALRDGKGSNCSVHVVVYVGGGQIVEASGSAGKVHITALPANINIVAYRPTDAHQAQKAVETARWFVSKNLKYSTKHCLTGAPHSTSWGRKAKARAAMIATRRLPAKEMMCSELAAFAYQGIPGKAYIELDAMRVSPLRLEDYMNSNPGKFRFAGAIPSQGAEDEGDSSAIEKLMAGVASKLEPGIDKARDAAQEAADKAKEAANQAEGVANQAKDKVEDTADKAKDKAKDVKKFLGF